MNAADQPVFYHDALMNHKWQGARVGVDWYGSAFLCWWWGYFVFIGFCYYII